MTDIDIFVRDIKATPIGSRFNLDPNNDIPTLIPDEELSKELEILGMRKTRIIINIPERFFGFACISMAEKAITTVNMPDTFMLLNCETVSEFFFEYVEICEIDKETTEQMKSQMKSTSKKEKVN